MNIYFLLSSERAGSNFISKVFNGHSRVCSPSIKHIFNVVARNLFRYGDLGIPGNRKTLVQDICNLINVDFSLWNSSHTIESLGGLFEGREVPKFILKIFEAEMFANGKEHLFIKENHVYEFIAFLLIHYPDAKYIFNVRDPRDVALSWKNSPVHKGGVISAAEQWRKDQLGYLGIYSALKHLNRACLVRYEDLISDPEHELEALCGFMGLEFDPGMLEFYKDSLTIKNSRKAPAWSNLSNKILADNRNKYKQDLSVEEVRYIEKICCHEMQWLGYELENTCEDLELIGREEVEKYDELERQTIIYQPTEELEALAQAKQAFYQRDIG